MSKYELLKDYMSKCPFIEFHEIAVDLNGEVADIRVAFDFESKEILRLSQ